MVDLDGGPLEYSLSTYVFITTGVIFLGIAGK